MERRQTLKLVLDDGGPIYIWKEDISENLHRKLLITTSNCINPECDCRAVSVTGIAVDDRYKNIEKDQAHRAGDCPPEYGRLGNDVCSLPQFAGAQRALPMRVGEEVQEMLWRVSAIHTREICMKRPSRGMKLAQALTREQIDHLLDTAVALWGEEKIKEARGQVSV